MEFLRLHRRRSRISDIAYIALNIGLVVTLFFVNWSVQTIWLSLGIVLLSKWRVFAVRPRFWWQNILANSVDAIVGLSYVVFIHSIVGAVWLQVALSVFYAGWLLFIKPRSKRSMVIIQAGVALFVGTTALSMMAYGLDSIVFVIGMWVIGYVTARHIVVHDEFVDTKLASLLWALIMAELGWLSHSWLFAYTLFGSVNLKLSQLALIVTLLGFIAERAITSYHNNGRVRRVDLVMPSVFALSLIVVLLLFFSKLTLSSGL